MRKLGPPPMASTVHVRKVMHANRRRHTRPERAVRSALRASGVRGYRVDFALAPGRPDIAFPRWKLAIFVHGCFWHRCPNCQPAPPKRNRAFWERKFELNTERDERKRRELEASGWDVEELWECEIRRDAKACASRIANTLAALRSHVESDEEAADLRASKAALPRHPQYGRR